MYSYYVQERLVADRQRRYMEAAERHRLVADRAASPGRRRAGRLAGRIWAVLGATGTLHGGPVVVAPSSSAIGS